MAITKERVKVQESDTREQAVRRVLDAVAWLGVDWQEIEPGLYEVSLETDEE